MRDREIVAATVAGDPAGLAGAYDTYAESVYGYCVWLLGEPDRAADAVQDVFVIAAACLGGLGDPRRLRPWLYAVARNQCHRRLRAGQAGLDAAAGLAGPLADAGENSERAGLRGLVRAALDGLTPGEREVIELGFRHDLSGADLAAVLGVSRNQAHALVSGARGRLERELGVPLVARTGRWACPTLDLMLDGWDGPLTGPMRKQVARHTGQCAACAYRRRSALRPAVLDGMAPLAALPRDLREKVLRLCADHSPLAQAYREEAAQRAGPFAARGFPRQVRQPRGRMLALAGAAAASVILIAIVAAGVITVLALGSRTPRSLGETSSRSGPAAASAAVTRTAGAARVSPGVSPAANQPETSAPPTVLVPSPSHPAPSSPPPPPTPSASASCPHPLPHHRCHRLGRARGMRPRSIWRLTCVEAVVAWDGFWAGDHNRDGSSEQSDGAGPGRAGVVLVGPVAAAAVHIWMLRVPLERRAAAWQVRGGMLAQRYRARCGRVSPTTARPPGS